jgi:HPt (histidine-containing phosphotransfer) domain-containing protein
MPTESSEEVQAILNEDHEQKAEAKATKAARTPRVAPSRTKPSRRSTSVKKAHKTAKKARAAGAREGSKTASVLALLRRAKGATLAEIMEVTSWQAHSVRGFISGILGKKKGLKVESEKRDDGVRVYSLPM